MGILRQNPQNGKLSPLSEFSSRPAEALHPSSQRKHQLRRLPDPGQRDRLLALRIGDNSGVLRGDPQDQREARPVCGAAGRDLRELGELPSEFQVLPSGVAAGAEERCMRVVFLGLYNLN